MKGIDKTNISVRYYQFFVLIQVSSDLSIVDLDVPFSFIFAVGATMNAYSNLGVLAVVTWQVLFVSIPVILLAIHLQVILCKVLFSRAIRVSFPSSSMEKTTILAM